MDFVIAEMREAPLRTMYCSLGVLQKLIAKGAIQPGYEIHVAPDPDAADDALILSSDLFKVFTEAMPPDATIGNQPGSQ